MTQLFLNYNDISENKINYELSKEDISNIEDINEIQMNLLELIDQQDSSLNRIEQNMSLVQDNMDVSVKHLKDADYNTIFYTPIIVGGLVGTILVSPLIGLVGLKSGMIFSLTGGLIGGVSGYKIQ